MTIHGNPCYTVAVQSVRRKYSQVPISDMAKGDVGQGRSSQRVETVAMDKIVKGVLPKSRIRACKRTSTLQGGRLS